MQMVMCSPQSSRLLGMNATATSTALAHLSHCHRHPSISLHLSTSWLDKIINVPALLSRVLQGSHKKHKTVKKEEVPPPHLFNNWGGALPNFSPTYPHTVPSAHAQEGLAKGKGKGKAHVKKEEVPPPHLFNNWGGALPNFSLIYPHLPRLSVCAAASALLLLLASVGPGNARKGKAPNPLGSNSAEAVCLLLLLRCCLCAAASCFGRAG